MVIPGLNAFYGHFSAALVRHGKLIAAADEERVRRIKHWSSTAKSGKTQLVCFYKAIKPVFEQTPRLQAKPQNFRGAISR